MKPWIVIPAYNESKNIARVLDSLLPYGYTVVVVDDGSRDATYQIARERGIVAIRHAINLGKGSALRTGCDYAYKNGAKIIVVMDADGQHQAEKIEEFAETIKSKGCDVVFGYRLDWQRMPFVLRFGNWFINSLIGVLFMVRLKDTQSGFRAFKADIYPQLRWQATDYFMESEMIANMGRRRLSFIQIPIPTIYSDKYKGTTVVDGMKIVCKMVLLKLS